MYKLNVTKWEYSGDRKRYLILIIYDIRDDKRRYKLSNFLQGYGLRVQESAFEASLTDKQIDEIVVKIPSLIAEEDDVRIYKTPSQGYIYSWSKSEHNWDQVIII